MRQSIAEHEIAEVLVVGQDDALLGDGDGKDFTVVGLVWKSCHGPPFLGRRSICPEKHRSRMQLASGFQVFRVQRLGGQPPRRALLAGSGEALQRAPRHGFDARFHALLRLNRRSDKHAPALLFAGL